MAVQRHNPKQITISFGLYTISGYADGTFVMVTRAEDKFSTYVGSDGQVTVNENPNDSGTVVITLSQVSPSNRILQIALDEKRVYGITVADLEGVIQCSAVDSWVQSSSAFGRAKETTNNEWTIACANLKMFEEGTAS